MAKYMYSIGTKIPEELESYLFEDILVRSYHNFIKLNEYIVVKDNLPGIIETCFKNGANKISAIYTSRDTLIKVCMRYYNDGVNTVQELTGYLIYDNIICGKITGYVLHDIPTPALALVPFTNFTEDDKYLNIENVFIADLCAGQNLCKPFLKNFVEHVKTTNVIKIIYLNIISDVITSVNCYDCVMKSLEFHCKLVYINNKSVIETTDNKCLHYRVEALYLSNADVIMDNFLDVKFPITVYTDLCTTISEISQHVIDKYPTCNAYVLMYTPDWTKIPLTDGKIKYIGAKVGTDMRFGLISNDE
jgi:hypothetical protein